MLNILHILVSLSLSLSLTRSLPPAHWVQWFASRFHNNDITRSVPVVFLGSHSSENPSNWNYLKELKIEKQYKRGRRSGHLNTSSDSYLFWSIIYLAARITVTVIDSIKWKESASSRNGTWSRLLLFETLENERLPRHFPAFTVAPPFARFKPGLGHSTLDSNYSSFHGPLSGVSNN